MEDLEMKELRHKHKSTTEKRAQYPSESESRPERLVTNLQDEIQRLRREQNGQPAEVEPKHPEKPKENKREHKPLRTKHYVREPFLAGRQYEMRMHASLL